jgi:hypothetical protein
LQVSRSISTGNGNGEPEKKIVVHVTTNQFRNQSSKLSANGIFNIIYIFLGIFGTKPDAWNVMKLKPAT